MYFVLLLLAGVDVSHLYIEDKSLVRTDLGIGLSLHAVSEVTGDVKHILGALLHHLQTFTEAGHDVAGSRQTQYRR